MGAGIVAGAGAEDAAFAGEAAKELGSREGLEESHHGDGDAAFLNELDEAFEDVVAIGIEAEDEAAHDLDAGVLDAGDAGEQIAAGVLEFVGGGEAGFVRSFDAEEDGGEAGLLELAEEVGIVGEIDGGFGNEAEGAAVGLLPEGEGVKKSAGAGFVADEVVVDDEDGAAPAGGVELIEFSKDVGDGFGAGAAAVDFDDVAELAGEGAAA